MTTTNTPASGQPLPDCCATRRRVRSLLMVISMAGAMVTVMKTAAILGFGMEWSLW